jgi:predicted  nucleic acid-binding Zn-ribbon protein
MTALQLFWISSAAGALLCFAGGFLVSRRLAAGRAREAGELGWTLSNGEPDLAARLNASELEASGLHHQIGALTRELSVSRQRSLELESALAESTSSMSRLESELAAARGQASRLESELAGTRSAASRIQGELAGTRSAATELQSQLATAQAEASRLESELAEARRAIASLEAAARQARQAAEEPAAERLASRRAAAAAEARAAELADALARAEAQAAEKNDQLRDRTSELEVLRGRLRDLDAIRADYVRLRTQRDESEYLRAELARLEGLLAEARSRPTPRRPATAPPPEPHPGGPLSLSESLARAIHRLLDANVTSVVVADRVGFPITATDDRGGSLAAYSTLLADAADRAHAFISAGPIHHIAVVDDRELQITIWPFEVHGEPLSLITLSESRPDSDRVDTVVGELASLLTKPQSPAA